MCHRDPSAVEAACTPTDAMRSAGIVTATAGQAARADRRGCEAHRLLTARSMARRTRRSLRGTALAEVGIVMLPLITISFAALDFAGILYTLLAMQNGVSQATRFAVTGNTMTDSSGASMPRDQAIRQAMRAATPGFQIDDGAFTFYDVSTGTSGTGAPKDIIRVTVTYDWQLLTPILRPFFENGYVTVRVASTMRNEPFP